MGRHWSIPVVAGTTAGVVVASTDGVGVAIYEPRQHVNIEL